MDGPLEHRTKCLVVCSHTDLYVLSSIPAKMIFAFHLSRTNEIKYQSSTACPQKTAGFVSKFGASRDNSNFFF